MARVRAGWQLAHSVHLLAGFVDALVRLRLKLRWNTSATQNENGNWISFHCLAILAILGLYESNCEFCLSRILLYFYMPVS